MTTWLRTKFMDSTLPFYYVVLAPHIYSDRLLEWIEIAGSDGIFHPALADIVDTTQVSVSSPYVSAPEYVRMGWHETAVPNLVNSEGLTATPFGATKAE